jgi:glycosyltransferase involved in cell wall biosynthesis
MWKSVRIDGSSGFGLPVVEAMAAGTATIVSNGGALPEIAGDAAAVFPAGDAVPLADLLARVLTDSRYAARAVERGRQRAQAYRWESVAARHIELYHRVAGARPASPRSRPVSA